MSGLKTRRWLGPIFGSVMLAIVAPSAAIAEPQDAGDSPESEKTFEEIQQERFIATAQRNFEYRLENQQYNIAIDIAMQLHDLEPKGGVSAYNAARVFSQIGDGDRAIEWLMIAVDHEFSHTQLLERDRMLVTVHARPEFEVILERSEANRLDQFERVKEEFDATELHSFIPPSYDEKNPGPLIVALHGRGVEPIDIFEPWINVAINRGAILVAPRGPREAKEGFAWLYEDESEWVVMRTIDRILENRVFDTSKIILTGFDEGAQVAFNVALSRPHEVMAAIPIGGQFDAPEAAPQGLEKDAWPAFYFMSGETDPLTMSARSTESTLEELGFDTELTIFPGVGHSLPEQYEPYLYKAVDWVLGKR